MAHQYSVAAHFLRMQTDVSCSCKLGILLQIFRTK